jgi:hypothetical protein
VKFVLVTVTLESDPRNPLVRMYRYPDSYDWQEIELAKRGPHMYQGTMTVLRMAESEELLLCLRDDVADKLAKDGSGLCREVTAAEADAWLAVVLASVPDEMVTNPTRVSLIEAKIAAGVELTQDDVDVLDVNNPKAVIARVPKTVEGIFELSAIEPAGVVEAVADAELPAAKG